MTPRRSAWRPEPARPRVPICNRSAWGNTSSTSCGLRRQIGFPVDSTVVRRRRLRFCRAVAGRPFNHAARQGGAAPSSTPGLRHSQRRVPCGGWGAVLRGGPFRSS
eukprot:1778975-Alexandrium_andersonii.AAC.1